MTDRVPLAEPAQRRFPRLRIGASSDRCFVWPERYLRLSVRAMIGLILLLALGFGWIANRAGVQREAVAAIERAGGKVWYQWEWLDDDADRRASRIGPNGSSMPSVSITSGTSSRSNLPHRATDDVLAQVGSLTKPGAAGHLRSVRLRVRTGPPQRTDSSPQPFPEATSRRPTTLWPSSVE